MWKTICLQGQAIQRFLHTTGLRGAVGTSKSCRGRSKLTVLHVHYGSRDEALVMHATQERVDGQTFGCKVDVDDYSRHTQFGNVHPQFR